MKSRDLGILVVIGFFSGCLAWFTVGFIDGPTALDAELPQIEAIDENISPPTAYIKKNSLNPAIHKVILEEQE